MADEGFLRRWARRKAERLPSERLPAERRPGETVPAGAPGAALPPPAASAATIVSAAPAPAARLDAEAPAPAASTSRLAAGSSAPAMPAPACAAARAAASAAAPAAPARLPTLDDAARLTADSDFSAFVARGVDAAVRRAALKTLFADPHFNAMDGLDVYIGDYTQPSPVSDAMLASLAHARQVLRRAVDVDVDDDMDSDGDAAPDAAMHAQPQQHNNHLNRDTMNIRLIDAPTTPDDPLQEARDRAARSAVLAALADVPPPEPLDTVGYRSAGRTLVVGTRADALPWAERLAPLLPVTVLLLDDTAAPGDGAVRLYSVVTARALVLTGWLGAFDATWQAPGAAPEHARFDLVLDLGAAPQIATHQRPHGYFAPGADPAARAAAADALADMVGEFEKPKYFAYKESLCAHGRNRKTGCTACVDICSAGAIAGAGDLVAVNPYLCAGCGACSTVCPSGAMRYAYPGAAQTGTRIRAALDAYAQAGGHDPVLLIHGAEGADMLAAVDATDAVPGRVLPLGVHYAASTGIDVWLAALAWGAAGVAVLTTDAEAPQYAAALDAQMDIAQAIMTGLGYAGAHMRRVHAGSAADLAPALRSLPKGVVPARRAGFHVAADKRNTLDYALEHLLREAPQPADEIALPAGSPYGTLAVDTAACSLCMACVGACPAGALQDGQNAPQLRFIEKNCVQCALCANTCPEDAIRLVPRLSLQPSRKQPVVLNETQPFHCIRCAKPFGTVRMVESMLARLAGHPAFAGHLDRMRMCGDCRVIDMMTPADEQTIDGVHELRRR